VAEAVKRRLIYGTAKPVPFVGRFISRAPAVNERLPLLTKSDQLEKANCEVESPKAIVGGYAPSFSAHVRLEANEGHPSDFL
jgi:hypothetical protein